MDNIELNIHELEATYESFPTFQEWAERARIDTVPWQRYTISLSHHAANSSPELLEQARNVAKRAAALDTGAIEGLYEVRRCLRTRPKGEITFFLCQRMSRG